MSINFDGGGLLCMQIGLDFLLSGMLCHIYFDPLNNLIRVSYLSAMPQLYRAVSCR